MRQLKGDNRGLSLLEVLIAMVVLSIVVVPFMHSFITAANTNADAKRVHKATTVAQSVMEGFKAEALEDILEQFREPAADFHLLDPGRINGSIADAVEVVTDPALPGEYRFEISGVQEDISAYDVLVTLDATPYRDPSHTDKLLYNAQELAKLPVIDMDKDAVCIQKSDYVDTAISQLRGQFSPEPAEDAVRNGMHREITVTIECTGMSGGDNRTRVLVDTKYSYGIAKYSVSQTYFDSTETGEELRSVYLYYYPLYQDGGSGAVTNDVINYVNPNGLPVNFYLLKQSSALATVDRENRYEMVMNMDEPASAVGSMQTRLYTNLGTNLVNGIAFTDMQGKREIFLNLSKVPLEDISAPELYESAAEDRLFDVRVSVYESGARAAGFPEDRRLATLEGSRID